MLEEKEEAVDYVGKGTIELISSSSLILCSRLHSHHMQLIEIQRQTTYRGSRLEAGGAKNEERKMKCRQKGEKPEVQREYKQAYVL